MEKWYRGGKIGEADLVPLKSRPVIRHLEWEPHRLVAGLDPKFQVCQFGCGYAVKLAVFLMLAIFAGAACASSKPYGTCYPDEFTSASCWQTDPATGNVSRIMPDIKP